MKQTDWDVYHTRPFPASRITRAILRKRLIRCLQDLLPDRHPFEAVELGGGGSCFMNSILHHFSVRKYHIFDNNRAGLAVLPARAGGDYESILAIHETDLLKDPLPELHCNLVFSAGLIEHFDQTGTKKLIRSHFQLVAPGGIVLLLFPVNTFLYRTTRRAAELFKLWIFHDERPLTSGEVAETALENGTLLHSEIIRTTVLSQCMMVFKKNTDGTA